MSVIDTARTMGSQHIGSVIVTHEGEQFGIFTKRDMLTHFLAVGKSLFTEVGANCSSTLVVIPSGTSIHRAAATIVLKHVRRLPLVRGYKLIGIITARDLVEAYAK